MINEKEREKGRRMGEGRRGEGERTLERSDINSGVISCYITGSPAWQSVMT